LQITLFTCESFIVLDVLSLDFKGGRRSVFFGSERRIFARDLCHVAVEIMVERKFNAWKVWCRTSATPQPRWYGAAGDCEQVLKAWLH